MGRGRGEEGSEFGTFDVVPEELIRNDIFELQSDRQQQFKTALLGLSSRLPLRVALLLDRSGPSVGTPYSIWQQQLAAALADVADESDELVLSVYGYSSDGERARFYEFRGSDSSDREGIARIPRVGGGGTPTTAAIAFGTSKLDAYQNGSKLVVVVTDSHYSGGQEAFAAQAAKAREKQITVVVLGQGDVDTAAFASVPYAAAPDDVLAAASTLSEALRQFNRSQREQAIAAMNDPAPITDAAVEAEEAKKSSGQFCPQDNSELVERSDAFYPGRIKWLECPTCHWRPDSCSYCGSLGWTLTQHGRVTHKQSCPHRTDAFCQSHPRGCPDECQPHGLTRASAQLPELPAQPTSIAPVEEIYEPLTRSGKEQLRLPESDQPVWLLAEHGGGSATVVDAEGRTHTVDLEAARAAERAYRCVSEPTEAEQPIDGELAARQERYADKEQIRFPARPLYPSASLRGHDGLVAEGERERIWDGSFPSGQIGWVINESLYGVMAEVVDEQGFRWVIDLDAARATYAAIASESEESDEEIDFSEMTEESATEEAISFPHFLEGKEVVLTGRFGQMRRGEVEAILRGRYRARVSQRISSNTDYLIVGDVSGAPGQRTDKMTIAERYGVPAVGTQLIKGLSG